MLYITRHGKERIKKRLGKKIPLDIAQKALNYGIKHSDASGSLAKYFDYLFFSHNGTGNNVRIYNEKVFIFNQDTLITVTDLPHCYQKSVSKLLRQKSERGECYG